MSDGQDMILLEGVNLSFSCPGRFCDPGEREFPYFPRMQKSLTKFKRIIYLDRVVSVQYIILYIIITNMILKSWVFSKNLKFAYEYSLNIQFIALNVI